MSPQPALELRNVTFTYGNDRDPSQPLLRGISFALEEGTLAALVGPNGAGKTTLLRLACGSLQPASGDVLLAGRSVAAMSHTHRARLVALVPQQLDVPFEFTVEQIVAQGRTPHLGLLRGPASEDRLAIDRALALTDTTHMRRRIFNDLSGGERQRVKIALGLAQQPARQPRLLLLDEPTQNLDIGRQAELMDLLHSLRDEGVSIFASIHDLHLVEQNFTTAHLLTPQGTILSGSPASILTAENLAAAFQYAGGHRLAAAMGGVRDNSTSPR